MLGSCAQALCRGRGGDPEGGPVTGPTGDTVYQTHRQALPGGGTGQGLDVRAPSAAAPALQRCSGQADRTVAAQAPLDAAHGSSPTPSVVRTRAPISIHSSRRPRPTTSSRIATSSPCSRGCHWRKRPRTTRPCCPGDWNWIEASVHDRLQCRSPAAPQHFLNFLPLPQGQGSFRPTLGCIDLATSRS